MVAAGDRERFSWMAEKAVELGVTRIVPLETARTVGVGPRLRDSHGEKLRPRGARGHQAVWRCLGSDGRIAPGVRSLPRPPSPGERVGWPIRSGEPPPATLDATPLTVVIGPEGGFTAEERAALLSRRAIGR